MEDPVAYDFLRVWSIRAALCALALVIVAILLLWRALRSRSWRFVRYSVMLLDVGVATAVAEYAYVARTTYQWYWTYDLGRSPPDDIVEKYKQALAARLIVVPQWGWTAVGVTTLLVIVNIALAFNRRQVTQRVVAAPEGGAPSGAGGG